MKTRMLIALIGAFTLRAASRACGPEMPVATLADHAAQVVVAEVQSVRSYWATDPRRIETELVLTDVEYLKGEYAGAPRTMTLTLPGGTVVDEGGEWGMRLCCAPEYKAGERWTLFILPTCKVHPVVGMERGSFRIVRDDRGVDRVRTADGRAVVSIDAQGIVTPARKGGHEQAPAVLRESGVRLVERADSAAQEPSAMSLEAFRARIAPALAQSRDHQLTKPAGERVPADHRAVPLKEAGGVIE